MNKLILLTLFAVSLFAQSGQSDYVGPDGVHHVMDLGSSYDGQAAYAGYDAVAGVVIPGVPGKSHVVECISWSAQSLGTEDGTSATPQIAVVGTHNAVNLLFGGAKVKRFHAAFRTTAVGEITQLVPPMVICPVKPWKANVGEAVSFGFAFVVDGTTTQVQVDYHDE